MSTAHKLRLFNLMATCVWVSLVFPTIFWWKESILWVAIMSIWANIAAHFSAYIASRAEEANDRETSS